MTEVSLYYASFSKSRLRYGETRDSIAKSLVETQLADVKEVEIARLRILFRLNPVEHVDLIKTLNALYNHSLGLELNKPGSVDKLLGSFTDEAQRVLKSEWRRVKRGESIFRITKWGSLVVVIVGALAGLIYAFRHMVASNVP